MQANSISSISVWLQGIKKYVVGLIIKTSSDASNMEVSKQYVKVTSVVPDGTVMIIGQWCFLMFKFNPFGWCKSAALK